MHLIYHAGYSKSELIYYGKSLVKAQCMSQLQFYEQLQFI